MKPSNRRETSRKTSVKLMPFKEPTVHLSCTPASTSISGLQGMRRSRFHSLCESVQHSHSFQFQECWSSLYESWSSLPVLPHFTVRVTHSQVLSEKTSSSHPLEERADSESVYAVQLFSLLSVSAKHIELTADTQNTKSVSRLFQEKKKKNLREWCVAVFFCMQSLRYKMRPNLAYTLRGVMIRSIPTSD